MNKLRIPLIRDALVDNMDSLSHILPLKDKHILDVGSGGGIIAEVCSNERQDGIIYHFIICETVSPYCLLMHHGLKEFLVCS
jgi:methylase of polypeptide subunit release factors